MNHPFVKMLCFEWKVNKKMWIITTSFGIIPITFLPFVHSATATVSCFSAVYLLTFIFTLFSYQESTENQSMIMYHLIPVHNSVKFLTKIFITLIAFPFILFLFFELINTTGIGTNSKSLAYERSELYAILLNHHLIDLALIFWFFYQAVSTLVAVWFKKYKFLYAMLINSGLNLLIKPMLSLALIDGKSGNNMTDISTLTWMFIVIVILTLAIYIIAYHLFLRRQL